MQRGQDHHTRGKVEGSFLEAPRIQMPLKILVLRVHYQEPIAVPAK